MVVKEKAEVDILKVYWLCSLTITDDSTTIRNYSCVHQKSIMGAPDVSTKIRQSHAQFLPSRSINH